MHPVSYLFEDIYRNYWGIMPASERPERGLARLRRRKRELLVQLERRQD